MNQSHGGFFTTEQAGSGIVSLAGPRYLVSDGAGGVTIGSTLPERYVMYSFDDGRDIVCLDVVTPVYLVSDGSGGMTHSLTGPATFILIDDGAGGMTSSSDLTQTPVADLRLDTGGGLWGVRRTAHRLFAVRVGVNVLFY